MNQEIPRAAHAGQKLCDALARRKARAVEGPLPKEGRRRPECGRAPHGHAALPAPSSRLRRGHGVGLLKLGRVNVRDGETTRAEVVIAGARLCLAAAIARGEPDTGGSDTTTASAIAKDNFSEEKLSGAAAGCTHVPSGAAAVPLGDFIKYGGAWARRGGLRFEHWRRLALQREASLRGEREKLGTAQGAVAEGKKGSASAEASEPKGKTFRESKSQWAVAQRRARRHTSHVVCLFARAGTHPHTISK